MAHILLSPIFFAGRVVTYGGETTPTVPDFVRENEYVGDFDGSRWLSGGSLYNRSPYGGRQCRDGG